MKGIKNFRASKTALPSMPCQTMGPYVFVQLASTGPDAAPTRSLEQDAGDVHSLLADTGYEELTFVCRREYTLPCNWKVFSDNFVRCRT